METRTIQVTMFKCTLCPNLRNQIQVMAGTTMGQSSRCKHPSNGGEKVISTVEAYPNIHDWCPLPKDQVNIL